MIIDWIHEGKDWNRDGTMRAAVGRYDVEAG